MSFWDTILGMICKKGISISYSDGKMFDPSGQVRTTPNEDFNKAAEAKRIAKGGYHVELDKKSME